MPRFTVNVAYLHKQKDWKNFNNSLDLNDHSSHILCGFIVFMIILARDSIYMVYPAVPLMSVPWSAGTEVVNERLASDTRGVMTSLT